MATTLLCRFCLSEVAARHTSGLFTVQVELKNLPSRLAHYNQVIHTISWLHNNGTIYLKKSSQYGVCCQLKHYHMILNSLPTNDTIQRHEINVPHMTNDAIWRHEYLPAFACLPQKIVFYYALPMHVTIYNIHYTHWRLIVHILIETDTLHEPEVERMQHFVLPQSTRPCLSRPISRSIQATEMQSKVIHS